MSPKRLPSVAVLVLLMSAGCGRDAAVHSAAPFPATGLIAGPWVGTFDTSDTADCHTNTPANALFEEQAERVAGTLNAVNACGLDGVKFDGVLTEGRLEGNLTRGTATGYAIGTLSDGRLELRTSDISDPVRRSVTPAGQMHLHRP